MEQSLPRARAESRIAPRRPMTDNSATLEQIVKRSGDLYSLPTVAMEVLELTNHPKVDAAKLKACIQRDPALTTKLLRVVNSSLFGLKQQVSDLNQALALLGIKPLKLLVLGFSLPDALFADLAGDVLSRYWKHTLTRAVAARELAEGVWRLPGDEAFIAGLLEGLGMLVLIQELGEPYVDLLKKVTTAGDYLTAIERHAIGFDHAQLTARLLAEWKLPPSLVEAVSFYEQPTDDAAAEKPCDTPALPRILRLAELLALVLADERTDVLPLVLRLGEQYHQITPEQLKSLVADLQEKVAQLADVLSLALPDDLAYRDLLEVAHEKLAEVAADAAGEMVRAQVENVSARIDSLKLLDEVRELSEAVSKFTAPKTKRPVQSPARTAGATTAAGSRTAAGARRTATTDKPASAGNFWAGIAGDGAEPSGRRGVGLDDGGRRRSQTDFEGTDVDDDLLARLVSAVSACRQSRCALSLLLVELDHYADLVFEHGVAGAEVLLGMLEQTCRDVDQPHAACIHVREGRFALVLVDCDRRQAASLGHELIHAIREIAEAEGGLGMTISVGSATVALPPRNFQPRDLVSAADRCLYGARLSGGGTLKSIEIY